MQEVEKRTKSHCEKRVQEARQETAEKVKQHYSKCLHQLFYHHFKSSCAQSHDVDAISRDPGTKYYPLVSETSGSNGNLRDQKSLKRTSQRHPSTISHPFSEPDLSSKPLSRSSSASNQVSSSRTIEPKISRKPASLSQSSSASNQISSSIRTTEHQKISISHRTKLEGGAERRRDKKGAKHKTSSRSVYGSTSKFVPSTTLILHQETPGPSPPTISWRVPVRSPPTGVHWNSTSKEKKPL